MSESSQKLKTERSENESEKINFFEEEDKGTDLKE